MGSRILTRSILPQMNMKNYSATWMASSNIMAMFFPLAVCIARIMLPRARFSTMAVYTSMVMRITGMELIVTMARMTRELFDVLPLVMFITRMMFPRATFSRIGGKLQDADADNKDGFLQ